MVDISPDSLRNNIKKKNPFKKILDDVKKFMKKDEEKEKKPVPLETPKKGKKIEEKKPVSFETSRKRKREKNKLTTAAKEPRKDKSPGPDQQPESSNISKGETTEEKESQGAKQERKGKNKEQKLPKKYRKGW